MTVLFFKGCNNKIINNPTSLNHREGVSVYRVVLNSSFPETSVSGLLGFCCPLVRKSPKRALTTSAFVKKRVPHGSFKRFSFKAPS